MWSLVDMWIHTHILSRGSGPCAIYNQNVWRLVAGSIAYDSRAQAKKLPTVPLCTLPVFFSEQFVASTTVGACLFNVQLASFLMESLSHTSTQFTTLYKHTQNSRWQRNHFNLMKTFELHGVWISPKNMSLWMVMIHLIYDKPCLAVHFSPAGQDGSLH